MKVASRHPLKHLFIFVPSHTSRRQAAGKVVKRKDRSGKELTRDHQTRLRLGLSRKCRPHSKQHILFIA